MIPVPIYDELDVSVRIRAVLEREGVCTFEQLCSLNDAELLRFKHLGRNSLTSARRSGRPRGNDRVHKGILSDGTTASLRSRPIDRLARRPETPEVTKR